MKLASVEKIVNVFPHPNADTLELVKVLGYQCIVPKGKWKTDDLCILIQPDVVLPDASWATFYNGKSSRVKAIRLRGEWSFGIVESLDILPVKWIDLQCDPEFTGEVSELLGITKYESPQPNNLEAKGRLPRGLPKTDEERWQNIDLSQFIDLPCIITQKIDGQSFTAYYKDGEFGVCGRTQEMKLEYDNNFTRNVVKYDLQRKLTEFCQKHGVNLALRGEQYGAGIQNSNNNPHSKLPVGLMFYSVWNFDCMRYESPWSDFGVFELCKTLDLPTVPKLLEMRFNSTLVENYSNAESLNGYPFEGIVIAGRGWSFKVINLNYDSKK